MVTLGLGSLKNFHLVFHLLPSCSGILLLRPALAQNEFVLMVRWSLLWVKYNGWVQLPKFEGLNCEVVLMVRWS